MSEYTADMIELLTAEPETEPHIVIAKDKTVIVPDELKEINTQFEHNIETVTFDCPRYWDEHDLSTMHIYVNVRRPDKKEIPSLCSAPVVDAADATVIHFDWTLSKDVTHVKGTLDFVAVAKKADENGILQNRWGSRLNRDMEILEGIECETDEIVEESADIIEQILYRLETAAATASASAARAERAETSAIDAAERANSVAASNPNLIDNWYFADPINQRGKTAYTTGYAIDRWTCGTSLTINNGSITFDGNLIQLIEKGSKLFGKTLTLSYLREGELVTGTATLSASYEVWGATQFGSGTLQYRANDVFAIVIAPRTNVIAIKLELGSVQTHAHQDAEGNWVLNDPPPDKGMELMKCCMSTADPADDYANNKKTPAAVGAVNKAGDTMKGSLYIKPDGKTTIGFIMNSTDAMLQTYAEDWNKRRFIHLPTEKSGAGYDDLQFYNAESDRRATIHHTVNKPQGMYTGNASARTIEIGGIGYSLVFLQGQNNWIGFVAYYGTIMFNTNTGEMRHFTMSECNFDRSTGLLTINTTDSAVNESGKTFYYIRL